MKKNELQNLRTKKETELREMIIGKKRDLAKSLSELKAGREKNLKKPKNIRRDIVQILTVIREKELIGQDGRRAGEQENES